MSESPYKRRLRAWKAKLTAELTRAGYEVDQFNGAFHLQAVRCGRIRRLRICFDKVTAHDERLVRQASATRCDREIILVEERGRIVRRIKIS